MDLVMVCLWQLLQHEARDSEHCNADQQLAGKKKKREKKA